MRFLGRLLGRPAVIPIAHEPGYHTDTIGTYDQGQYFGSIHGAARENERPSGNAETRWYAYVHTFDTAGNHHNSEIRLVGTGLRLGDSRERAEATLTELLGALPGRQLGDIRIKPFKLIHDGVLFGMIDETGTRGLTAWVELYPDGLGFHAPWNGEYDT